jgi:hypothetical protein
VIRAVLAVLLAAALLSISLPAVDGAGEERTIARMDRAVEDIETSATDLLAEERGPTARLGPRRVIDVRLPDRSLTTVEVEWFAIDGMEDSSARISYRLSDRRPTHYRSTAPIATPDGPVVFRAAGGHTVVLRLVGRGGDATVLVDRRDGDQSGGSSAGTRPGSP